MSYINKENLLQKITEIINNKIYERNCPCGW